MPDFFYRRSALLKSTELIQAAQTAFQSVLIYKLSLYLGERRKERRVHTLLAIRNEEKRNNLHLMKTFTYRKKSLLLFTLKFGSV